MKTIAWTPGITLPMDPDGIEIWQWDWSDWLDGDTLANPPTIIAEPGITADLEFLGAHTVDVRVLGAPAGNTYAVTVRATSATTGRRTDRTVRFAMTEH